MAIHKDFRKGKRVCVIFEDGYFAIGKFVGSSSQFLTLTLENGETHNFRWRDIRATTINKPKEVLDND